MGLLSIPNNTPLDDVSHANNTLSANLIIMEPRPCAANMRARLRGPPGEAARTFERNSRQTWRCPSAVWVAQRADKSRIICSQSA